MTDILMPALSPTMEEGVLAKWHVKPGDVVSSGDVIAEIETDKATMEVEAVDEGEVAELLVAEGTEGVKVNTPIARLKGGEGSGKGASFETPASPAPQDDAKGAPANNQRQAEEVGPAPVSKPAPAPAPKTNGAAQPTPSGERVFASPLARRLAQQKGVDLKALKGSGPRGRVIARDIEGAKPGQAPAQQAGKTAPAAEPRQVLSLEQMGIPAGSYDLIPLDNVRKVSARRLTDSFRDIPHFPLTIDCEIDRLLEARSRINAALETSGVKVSVNDIVIKAAAMALKQVPEANASFTPEGIALHHHADVSMAVAIEGGLITPIIFKAETKGLAQIATETKDLAKRARERKLKPQEFQGGTFSVSNLGMFGVKSFASIINEPQGCIMSVGAGDKRPVVRGDRLEIATVMSITLTCDHRVVDGATGARFLQAFKVLVEDPVTMLA